MENDDSPQTWNGSLNQEAAKTTPILHLIDMWRDFLEIFSVVLVSMHGRDVSNKPVAIRNQGQQLYVKLNRVSTLRNQYGAFLPRAESKWIQNRIRYNSARMTRLGANNHRVKDVRRGIPHSVLSLCMVVAFSLQSALFLEWNLR